MGLILEARDLSFAYPGGRTIFSGLDLTAAAGEIVCILGPNGTGKSTLVKCLAGLYRPLAGSLSLAGREAGTLGRAAVARIAAYVPQLHQGVFAFSVFEVVLMGRAPHLGFFGAPGRRDREVADRAIAALGIEHLAGKPYTDLSGGERQLVLFARILAQEPRLLLLDEPTSHLDFGNQVQVLALIRRLADQGLAVIMTSHFPDHAFLTSRTVAVMAGGRFMAVGRPGEVVTEERLAAVYGVDVRIVNLDGYGTVCVPLLPEARESPLNLARRSA